MLLQLHLLLLLPLLPETGAKVVFEEIGEMASSLTYVHVTIPLDLTEIIEQITLYDDSLKELKKNLPSLFYDKTWDDGQDTYLQPVIDLFKRSQTRLEDVVQQHLYNVDDIRYRLNSLRDLLPEPEHPLQERNLVLGIIQGVAGTLMGLYDRKKMNQLRETVNTLQSNQMKHFAILKNLTVEITKVHRMIDGLHKGLTAASLTNPAFIISSLMRTESHLHRILDIVTNTIQQLQHRRMSVDFLQHNQLLKVFNNAKTIADATSCRLIPEHPSDLFQLETSFFASRDKITIILHIPMAPRDSTLRLFRFRPFPIALDNDTTLLPKVDADVLAISQGNRYTSSIRYADLMDCHNINRFFMCERHGVLQKSIGSSCLSSLYNQNFTAAALQCDMQMQPYKEAVLQLQNRNFLIYSPVSFTASARCQNNTEVDFHLTTGIVQLQVPPSCRLQLNDHIATADLDLAIDIPMVHFDWKWDPSSLQLLTSPSLRQAFQDQRLNGNDKFLLSDLLQTSSVHHDLETMSQSHSSSWSFILGFVITFSLILVFALSFLFYGYHRFSFFRTFINRQLQALDKPALSSDNANTLAQVP